MTENKRFKKISVCGDWGIKDVQNDTVLFFATTDEVNDTFEVLNELNNQADAVREELRLCEEENNALQERNDRQYEILRKLYTLIENKDWKGLTAHMEELDKCEEQLRKEWRLYSD